MRLLISTLGVGALLGAATLGIGLASQQPPAPGPPPAPLKPGERFDKLIREDMFAGFGGDPAALGRGLARCEATLQADPKHAEALVWRGAARVFQAAELFGKKSFLSGMSLWSAGVQDMDDAVKLDPTNPGVRIPRAAVLLPAARNAPAAMGRPLLDRALDDFTTMARLQADKLGGLGDHPLGELRMGLADVYRMRGELARSREQLELIRAERPNTEYATRAQEWLAAPADAKLVHNCIGCHGQ